MRFLSTVAPVLACLLLPAALARGDTLLWNYSWDLGGGSGGGQYQEKLAVGLFIQGTTGESGVWTNRLFDDSTYWLTATDDGAVHTISSNSDDPQFSIYADRLTDGLNNNTFGLYRASIKLAGTFGGGASRSFSETRMLFGSDSDPRIDLQGFNITRIVREIQTIDIQVYEIEPGMAGYDPRYQDFQFQSSGRVTFRIYGDPVTSVVPSPSAAFAGILLFPLLAYYRPNKRV